MVKITDHPNMTSVVYHGHLARNQTNKWPMNKEASVVSMSILIIVMDAAIFWP